MPRMQDVASRDETMTRTFQIKTPSGGTLPVRVEFFPNRMTWEGAKALPGEDDEDTDGDRTTLRAATNFVDYVTSWDMDGPWLVDGEEIASEGQMIPITVPVIRSVAAWITSQIMMSMMETVFPNFRRSQESRRR